MIFQRFYGPLRTFFANRPALQDEAEDLAQAALFRAFERIHLYRQEEEAGFAAWLRTLAENVWKNAVRERLAALRDGAAGGRRWRWWRSRPGGAGADARPNPEEVLLAHERTRVLRDAIESLPPGMRQCTELRLFADLKYQEISRITGIGLNSVRSQLFEARQRLKPVLDHYFQGADL